MAMNKIIFNPKYQSESEPITVIIVRFGLNDDAQTGRLHSGGYRSNDFVYIYIFYEYYSGLKFVEHQTL